MMRLSYLSLFFYIYYYGVKYLEKYIVKSGDTLYGISNQYGVSVTELAELNKVNAYTLKIGSTLLIPSRGGNNPDAMFLYTVKKGDTLYNLARVYGTSVAAIKSLNYLKDDNLSVGQVIRIPEMFVEYDEVILPSYKNYIVKKGDTLYSIARDNNTSVDIIINDNALKTNVLKIGQNLKIRTDESEILECFGEEYSPVNNYVVKKGDTLYSIAKKFGVSVSDILNKNKLKSSSLSIGQVLNI